MPRRRRRDRRGPRGSSVRVTRTSGSGQNRSYQTGGLSITGVGPTGRVAGSGVTIRATVRDQGTTLSKNDIRLYLDGSQKSRFRYDPGSGQLSFYVGRALTPGAHEVRIEAEARSSGDKTSFSGTSRKSWTFTVVRR